MRLKKALCGLVALGLFAGAPAVQAKDHDKGRRDKTGSTVLGIGIGLLGGALLSDGDPWATLAGAAAGGAIGHAAADDRGRKANERRWREERRWRDRRDRSRRDDPRGWRPNR